MAIRRGAKEVKVGSSSPAWFTSYSDLVTQLLVFFVMLFALGAARTKSQLEDIQKRIQKYAADNHIETYIHTDLDSKGLTVSLSDRLMFRSGEAELVSEDARRHIGGIAEILKDYSNSVSIEGHTDNRPIRNNLKYPTNWELSTARATNLTRFLIEKADFQPDRLSSAGYGEYHPVVPSDSEENLARNRRVDIVVSVLSISQQRKIREAQGMKGREFQRRPKTAG